MKNIKVFLLIFTMIMLQLFLAKINAQIDNPAMDFDGIDDFISLPLLPTSFPLNSPFTAEAWVNATPSSAASCIMALTDGANTSTIFLGLNGNGSLFVAYTPTSGTGGFQTLNTSPANVTGACHHFVLQHANGIIYVWMDGVQIFTSGPPPSTNGPYDFNYFYVGNLNNLAPFKGQMDEIRLWNTIRSAQQINDFKDCSLSGNPSSIGLVVNWTFDQGIPNGTNTGAQAIDYSGSTIPNNGMLNNFALTGTSSNFVSNGCPSSFNLDITDIQYQLLNLISICEGTSVHFCVKDHSGNPILIPSGTVTWQSSVNSGPFLTDADLALYTVSSPFKNALCFPIKKNKITSPDCMQPSQGYTDRKYRAKVEKIMGAVICTYTTSEQNLQICCPPTGGSISIIPNISPPWCEGDDVSMTIQLQPTDAWLAFGPLVTIDWCIVDANTGSTMLLLPQGQNQLTFNLLNYIIGTDDICIQAKITNCICPTKIIQQCFSVDPIPVCGSITVSNPSPFVTQISPNQYTICPNHTTDLSMVNPANFMNCTPVWQYSFSTSGPWNDLGTSNSIQNTNYLPTLKPPAPWPNLANCIYYRIECRPQSYPNSGCDPCHTNVIEICLQPVPPSGIISGNQQFCDGSNTTLTITPNPFPLPPSGGWTYTWYYNGVYFGSGSSIVTNKPGCYWVEIGDIVCQATKVGPYCITKCLIVPVIKCPEDNPCACDNMPITLDGCDSYSTCGNPLSYSWSASNNGPCVPGPNGPCECVHTPDSVNGTDYILTITDLVLGCNVISKTIHILPCQ